MEEQLKQLVDVIQKGTAEPYEFDEIAKRIAEIVIESFSGELLEKGLLLVKAICDFGAVIEREMEAENG
jgi:hypothetical protein